MVQKLYEDAYGEKFDEDDLLWVMVSKRTPAYETSKAFNSIYNEINKTLNEMVD